MNRGNFRLELGSKVDGSEIPQEQWNWLKLFVHFFDENLRVRKAEYKWRFLWGPTQITGANVYLWPRGPTWPKAVEASNNLLNRLTQEIVLSRTGLRFITGDFNREEKLLDGIEIWKQQGWVDAQTYASEQWGREICATCKGKTVRDHIWLSPEFLPHIQKVQVWPVFADHSGVGVCIDLPITPRKDKVWPMPSSIPWQHLDKDSWQKEAKVGPRETTPNVTPPPEIWPC